MPGLASTTAAGLPGGSRRRSGRRLRPGLALVTGRMLVLPPGGAGGGAADGPVTIDLDTTDVEVYGHKKGGVAYNH